MSLQQLDGERQQRVEAPFIAEATQLFAQVRAELLRAQNNASLSEDKFNEIVDKQEGYFDSQLNAMNTKFDLAQSSINQRVDQLENTNEVLRNRVYNCLGNLYDLASRKSRSLFAQVRARELQTFDAVPFGSWRFDYNTEGSRIFTSSTAQPQGPVSNPQQQFSASTQPASSSINPYTGAPAQNTPPTTNPYQQPPQVQSPYPGAPSQQTQPYYPPQQPSGNYGIPPPQNAYAQQPQYPGYGGYPPPQQQGYGAQPYYPTPGTPGY